MDIPWQLKLLDMCFKNKAEPTQSGSKIIIITPKKLGVTEQSLFRSIVPEEVPLEFRAGPKQATIEQVKQILVSAGAKGDFISDTPNAIFKIRDIDVMDPVWGQVTKILEGDGYFKSWTIQVEGSQEVTINPDVVRAISTHKVRSEVITEEDIKDLNIFLNASGSVDEFLGRI